MDGSTHSANSALSRLAKVKTYVKNRDKNQGQAGVADVIADLQSRGLRAETEFGVKTPGGIRPSRYVDVAGLDSAGNPVEFHQVGRQTQSGIPVARERQAIQDILGSGSTVPITFHPYN